LQTVLWITKVAGVEEVSGESDETSGTPGAEKGPGGAMKKGLKGNDLPESMEDFAKLVECGRVTYKACVFCHKDISWLNTKTPAGWRESQISGSCEKCFDLITQEPKDGDEDSSTVA
jgi:hypothetical protein